MMSNLLDSSFKTGENFNKRGTHASMPAKSRFRLDKRNAEPLYDEIERNNSSKLLMESEYEFSTFQK